MKIGLIDVDGHNFPNLALMKISAFHKDNGDDVEWYNNLSKYNKVYMSKVFTFTPDYLYFINSDDVIKGGTGYNSSLELPLEIDNKKPDYSLYPINDWNDGKTAYRFITRGCIRKCSWCIVPIKEGSIHTVSDINTIADGFQNVILMDNNILASKECINQLNDIIKLDVKVDFNQGLDARLVTDQIAKLLSKIKWIRYIRFSFDQKEQLEPLLNAIQNLNKYGIKNSKIFVYCLIKDLHDSYLRINECKKIKINPFAQPYRDFTQNQIIPQWQKDMARWCNHKAVFKSIDFMDYNPRTGFYCSKYFK